METIKKSSWRHQASLNGKATEPTGLSTKETISKDENFTKNSTENKRRDSDFQTIYKSMDKCLDEIIEKIKKLDIVYRGNLDKSSDSADSAIQSSRQSSPELSDQEADSLSSHAEEKESSGIGDLNEEEEEVEEDDENLVWSYDKCPYLKKPWVGITKSIAGKQDNGYRISKIEHYLVPKEYKNLLKNNLEITPDLSLREKELLINLIAKYEPERKRSNSEAFAYTAVNRSNYKEFFQDLLYFEEQEQKYKMASYNMFGVRMPISFNKKDGTLYVPGLAEKRPSILRKDIIFVRIQDEPMVQFSGFVKDVRNEHIIIRGFSPYLLKRLSEREISKKPLLVDVRFTISRYPFYVQHRAFDLIKEGTLDKVFPEAATCGKWPDLLPSEKLKEIKFINPDIEENEEQKQAIFSILKGTSLPAPYIIFGPPGTGKTVTFVEAILQVKANFFNSHILVCAQGNSACDYIAIKLLESGGCAKDEILRLNSAARMEEVPREIFHISNSCPKKQIINTNKFRIIVCTLVTAGRFIEAPMRSIKKKTNYQTHTFTHLFIDEAGQASEPETLVAISGLLQTSYSGHARGQLVLAGDPKQLGPVCNGIKAKIFGLGVSLMERLMANMSIYQIQRNGEYDSRFITQLVKNFRSHGEILEISNKLFYNDKLKPQGVEDELCMCPLVASPTIKGSPVIFHGVLGREEKEERSPSVYNKDEIKIVIEYIKQLLNCDIKMKVKPGEIGVVAPYALQVHKLREEIRRHPGWSNIQVGSTEVFQGREKRVIIVSTVRSQSWKRGFDRKFNLGFVKEPKRFNVIMTRAQSKLIVVGNPRVLQQDKCWRFLIKKTLQSNSYRGCPFRL